MTSVLLLAFASGLPIMLIISMLQAWLTEAGLAVTTIGFFSLVQQPYAYKFLWAPLFDRFSLPFLDHRRAWVFVMQLAIIVMLIVMAMIDPKTNPELMWGAALLAAIFSSTQDISSDAYRTELLPDSERGLGSSFYLIGYRIAMLTSGAFALGFAAHYSFRAAYLLMAGFMCIGIIGTLSAPKLKTNKQRPEKIILAFIEPIKEFMSRPRCLWILLVIIFYKFGDAFTLSLSTTFLLRGVHFSLVDLAFINKVGGLLATILGGVVGGIIMTRVRLFSSLMLFGIFQTITNLGYMLLAIVGKSYVVMAFVVIAENFFGGMGTIAFLAFLMALCDQRYTATQFAVFSAIDSIGRIFIGPLAGFMVAHIGWVHFYFWAFIAGIPSLIFLLFIKTYIDKLTINTKNA